jgi:predicted methyltransferase
MFPFRSSGLLLLGVLLAGPAPSQVAPEAPVSLEQQLRDAMDADIRTERERARDANRKPVETLQFFRLDRNMRVLELVPGGGWYTKLLAPVLAQDGKLFVAIGTGSVEKNLLGEPGFENVEVVDVKGEFGREGGRSTVNGLALGVEDIDLALTFRNLHNFTEAGRMEIHAAVFDVLRPDGLYGVVDHTRRHMAEDTSETRRRMDPVQMIREIESAGFDFVDYSTLHYRPDDELRYEVGRRTVTGNTDRFTLLFRKPQ